jgi:protein-L-isoaspartate(D-aspartate) O-methyltransferase
MLTRRQTTALGPVCGGIASGEAGTGAPMPIRTPMRKLCGIHESRVPRHRMVERIARAGRVADPRVLRALAAVPRHRLVPEALRGSAYRDAALPIGEGQTISAPGIVGAMTQALELRGDERVLEIGTGSGYQAALLSLLAREVVSVERVPALAQAAREGLRALGVEGVRVVLGDGSAGVAGEDPFDAIVVTAGGPRIPEPLLRQLARGGRLVGPFGGHDAQWLLRVRRDASGALRREVLGRCRFVDLVGAYGWAA